MIGIDRRLLQNVDWPLIGATVGLVVLSASTLARLHVGRAGGGVAVRQLAWFGVGMIALVVVASIDYRRLVRMAPLIYLLGLAALDRGVRARAARCRARVGGSSSGPCRVQPSELFKLCFVLMAVWLLTSRWAQPISQTTLVIAAAAGRWCRACSS